MNELATQYQEYIHKSRYARWREEDGRRENWGETVERYIDFFSKRSGDILSAAIFSELRDAITNLEVMPSMRTLMTAWRYQYVY